MTNGDTSGISLATLTPYEDSIYTATEKRVAGQCQRGGMTPQQCAAAATQAAQDAVDAHRRRMRAMRAAANEALS